MKSIVSAILLSLLFPFQLMADNTVKTVTSPQNRVALLELYTSEGCSSCPPADRFLTGLKEQGISSKQLIPVAFHVTYWDYIGWKDRFAHSKYDSRQRQHARRNNSPTVYTPQFLLAGDDFREYTRFSNEVNKLVAEKSTVNLELTSIENQNTINLVLSTDISDSPVNDVGLYFAVIENNLTSDVVDGENEGELLHHDYVVRQLHGPFFHRKPETYKRTELTVMVGPEWKLKDLSVVAFAENPLTGEVLQAVKLKY